eukprot:EST43331.1 Hypothetical protein SS50377_17008 [Spironucleus salmonicida]
MIQKVEEQQTQLMELAQLYESADDANKASTEQLVQFQQQNENLVSSLKIAQDKLTQSEELLHFRDKQLTVLQNQLLKFTHSGLVPDQASFVGLIPPSSPENMKQELQMLRDSLQFTGIQHNQPLQVTTQNNTYKEEIAALNKKVEDLNFELNENKFKKSDMSENAVVKQLEKVINDLREEKQELGKVVEIQKQEIQNHEQLKGEFSSLQMINVQQNNDLNEKDNDIMQFIQAISELQSEKSEIEIAMQMMSQQSQFSQNQHNSITVNQMIQSDISMQNAAIMFNIDLQNLETEIRSQCEDKSNEILNELLQDLTQYTTLQVTKMSFNKVVKEIIQKQIETNMQLTQYQNSKFEETQVSQENKVQLDQLRNENLTYQNQLENEKNNADMIKQQIDDNLIKIRLLQEEIVSQAQNIGEKELRIENQSQKITELESILIQAKGNLQKFENLGENNQTLLSEMNNLTNENQGLKVELQVVKNAHQEISKQTEIQEKMYKQLQDEHAKLDSLLQDKFNESETLKNTLQSKDQQTNSQSQLQLDQINQITVEIKHLKSQLDEANDLLRESNRDLMDTKQQHTRAEAILSEKDNQIIMERNKNLSCETQIAGFKDQIKTLGITMDKLRNEKEELLLKYTDLKVEKNVLENDKQNVDSQYKEKLTNLEKELQITQSQNDDFNKVLTAKNQEITELEVELRKYVAQFNEKNLKVEDVTMQKEEEVNKYELLIGAQKSQISEIESQLMKLCSENQYYIDEKMLLQKNIQQKDTQIQQLQNQVFQQEKQVKNLQVDLEKGNNEHNRLRRDLEHTELEITRREESFLSQTELIKTKFEDYTQKQLEREISKKNQEISRLQTNLEQKQGEFDAVKQDFTHKINENTQALNQIDVINRKLIQQEQLTARIRQNSQEMKEQYENKINNLRQENQRVVNTLQNNEMNFKLQETQRSGNLREEYNKQIEQLVGQLKDLQLENEKIKVRIQMENVEKERSQQEISRISLKMKDAEDELQKQLKGTEKYRDLYKKAYQVVEKMKEKERSQKQVIDGLEQRVDELARRQASNRNEGYSNKSNYTPGAW